VLTLPQHNQTDFRSALDGMSVLGDCGGLWSQVFPYMFMMTKTFSTHGQDDQQDFSGKVGSPSEPSTSPGNPRDLRPRCQPAEK
jgi:hypothetical protein